MVHGSDDDNNNEFLNSLTGSIVESNDKVTNAIQEQTETSKGIWDTLKDVLSYINPFSENFFVYKLIELLVEGLKALFIPSDDFFINWINDMNDYFSDIFGILYYPLEIVIEFLNRIGDISETSTAVIHIPSFTLSFMGYSGQLWSDYSFDLNTILENETFNTIHNVYLVFVDILLWLGLVYLAGKFMRQVIGGMGDEVDNVVTHSRSKK